MVMSRAPGDLREPISRQFLGSEIFGPGIFRAWIRALSIKRCRTVMSRPPRDLQGPIPACPEMFGIFPECQKIARYLNVFERFGGLKMFEAVLRFIEAVLKYFEAVLRLFEAVL